MKLKRATDRTALGVSIRDVLDAVPDLSRATLDQWVSRGLLKLSHQPENGRARRFSFADVLKVRVMAMLCQSSMTTAQAGSVLEAWDPYLTQYDIEATSDDVFLMVIKRRAPGMAVETMDFSLVSASDLTKRLQPDATGRVHYALLANVSELARDLRANLGVVDVREDQQ
jgi:hypothetical protein